MHNEIRLMYHSHIWTCPKKIIEPHWWYQACLLHSLETISFYIDGQHICNSRQLSSPLPLNGTIVFGNDQDTLGGGFTPLQAYRGLITSFNIWPKVLHEEEILALGYCKQVSGRLLAWEQIPWQKYGHVETQEANPCEIKEIGLQFTLPKVLERKIVSSFCSEHGLRLPLPKTEEENMLLASKISTFDLKHCLSFSTPSPKVWLDVVYNSSMQMYVDESSGQISYFKPVKGMRRKFVVLDTHGDWKFDDGLQCGMCIGKPKYMPYYMQGLCSEHSLAQKHNIFYIRGNNGTIFHLQGTDGVVIAPLSKREWNIRHTVYDTLVATLKDSLFPFGTKQWELHNSEVICKKEANYSKIFITISNCGPGSFTCWDGTCVPLSSRCTLVSECRDGTDEMECFIIHPDESYQRHLSPVKQKLNLIVSLILTRTSVLPDILNVHPNNIPSCHWIWNSLHHTEQLPRPRCHESYNDVGAGSTVQ
ncbi:hypothetical protein SK128_010925 [Halocaridina rubra]|uniref:Pentraxin (PTX) domain-containing protein n=1 Tax=Halocaridina rubra TaxID=373956 RepID=A0AAN8WC34_HALRR